MAKVQYFAQTPPGSIADEAQTKGYREKNWILEKQNSFFNFCSLKNHKCYIKYQAF